MTFIVNYDGVVYQKDLGPKTAELAPKITRFDPGDGERAFGFHIQLLSQR